MAHGGEAQGSGATTAQTLQRRTFGDDFGRDVSRFRVQLPLRSVSSFGEQILRETAKDSFDDDERARLIACLDQNAPLREDVLTLLAQFKVNLGPFFLRALLDHFDGRAVDGGIEESDPVRFALRAALAIPAGELTDQLLADEPAEGGATA